MIEGKEYSDEEIEAAVDRATCASNRDGEAIMKYFKFSHLRESAPRAMSRRFTMMALLVYAHAPRCAELTIALRKLLEGKDAAVRAVLP